MKKIITLFLSVLALGFATGCSSDDDIDIFCSVYGTVTETVTGEPINNATITIAPGNKTTISGQDGYFVFEKLEEGQYTITVQKSGYSANRKTVTAVAGEKIKADIPLTKAN